MESVQEQAVETVQLVTFKVNEEFYASEIIKVQEIVWLTSITRVPTAPQHIIGVINLRGQIIPIISMTKRLNLSAEVRQDELSRIIVFRAGELVAGIIVDEVSEVAKVPKSDIDSSPEVQSGAETTYIKGIAKMGKKVIILLDIEKVILGDKEGANG